jgi:DNA invertase Pin-like site-specific DNA recombinase
MTAIRIGYARCSTDKQDLTAQRQALLELGVDAERIYLDHGLTGTNRNRPGLGQALAAVRPGDTLVVPKLDRLARSVPDARDIGDSSPHAVWRSPSAEPCTTRPTRWARCSSTSLPPSPSSKSTCCGCGPEKGMAIATSKGKLRGKQPKLTGRQQAHLVQLHAAGEHNIAELAELFAVSRPTVYRVLERHRASTTSA